MTSDIDARMAEIWDSRHRELLGLGHVTTISNAVDVFVAYTDELQREGDPRGSLIALDLLPGVGDIERDREDLLRRWLGDDVAGDPAIGSRCGLITVGLDDDRGIEVLEKVLRSAGAAYIEAVSVTARARAIDLLLRSLCERVHPWLGRLFVRLQGTSTARDRTVISDDLLNDIVRSMPKMYLAEVAGSSLVRSFSHPALLRLAIDGYDTVASVTAPSNGSSCPVVEVDLAMHRMGDTILTSPVVSRLFPRESFPAVTRLDLSRNERGVSGRRHLGGAMSIYSYLEKMACLEQLTHVHLPSMRSMEDATSLRQAFEAMANLEYAEIAACYGASPVEHPTAKIKLPRCRSWFHPDEGGDIKVTFPDQETFYVDVGGYLERDYDCLAEDVANSWNEFWNAVRTNRPLPTSRLFLILKASQGAFQSDGWIRISHHVCGAPQAGTVRLERVAKRR